MNNLFRKSRPCLGTLLCLFTLTIQTSFGQEEERMKRDLTVMDRVIRDIFNSYPSFNVHHSFTRSAEYISSFGVIVYVPELNYSNASLAPRQLNDSSSEGKKGSSEEIVELMKLFLIDYGDLAGFMPNNEKIKVIYKSRSGHSFDNKPFLLDSDQQKKSEGHISAEVVKADILAYRSGEITQDDLIDRIEVITNQKKEDDISFNIFKNILKETLENRLNSENGNGDQTQTGYHYDDYGIVVLSSGPQTIQYERLEGLGVIYNIKLRSPSGLQIFRNQKGPKKRIIISGQNIITYDDRGNEDEDDEEGDVEYYNELSKELYNEVIEDVQDIMINYGRTLRKLSEDEYLIVRLQLPACKDCDLPATVESKIQKSTLTKFDKGELSTESAVDMIELEEKGEARNQKTSTGSNYFRFDSGWGSVGPFHINVPEIEIPELDIEIPHIDVDIPGIHIPSIVIPEIDFYSHFDSHNENIHMKDRSKRYDEESDFEEGEIDEEDFEKLRDEEN